MQPKKVSGFLNNKILPAASLVLITLLVYFPTFHNQFQDFWDDQWVVINQYTEAGFRLTNLYKILSEFYHGQYAPVNQLFYTTLYSLFDYKPVWFHGLCLLVHILNTLLVFSFISRLLLLSGNFESGSVRRIAFVTALLFALHPFLVEAVAWISASKIILYTLFYLTALHYYLSFTQSFKLRYYLAALLFFIISFGAKEQAVTLPICFVLIDYALKRNLKNINVWLEKLPVFILAISFGIFTMLSQAVTGSGALSNSASYPFYQKVIFASYTFLEYLFKCLIPYKLSYLYPFPNLIGQPVALRFWPYPFVIIAVIACLWSFLRQRWVFFGMMFFLIHIGIALHIVSISRFAIVADRYVYLASVGIFFVLAWLLDSALRMESAYKKALIGCGIIYLCALGIYTNSRIKAWYNTDSLKNEIRQVLKQRKDYRPNL